MIKGMCLEEGRAATKAYLKLFSVSLCFFLQVTKIGFSFL